MNRYAIYCPGSVKSGGPEALHQLTNALTQLGFNAGIIYYGVRNQSVVDYYKEKYNTNEISSSQTADTIGIIPESYNPLNISPDHKEKWVWWLSGMRVFKISSYLGFGHLTQSHFAKKIIDAHGYNSIQLSDYIHDMDFTSIPAYQRDIVAFNGGRSANSVLSMNLPPKMKLKPLIGYSDEEVKEILERTCLYVDFGVHPGKDRGPREAAIAHALVVTNRINAANDSEDLPIPSLFKIENYRNCAPAREMLIDFFDNYNNYIIQQNEYREHIFQQKSIFLKEVKNLTTVSVDLNPCKTNVFNDEFDEMQVAAVSKAYESIYDYNIFISKNSIEMLNIYNIMRERQLLQQRLSPRIMRFAEKVNSFFRKFKTGI